MNYAITIDSLSASLNEAEQSEELEISELADTAETTNQTVMAASMVSGAASGDFSAAWNFMNILQILAFIPMMSTKLPLPLSAVLSSFLEFSMIPNLFEYALEDRTENEPEPHKEAVDFGFETSTFLINGGEML